MAAPKTLTWVDIYESVADTCTEDVLMTVDQLLSAMGPRQFGFVRGSALDQVAQYLDMCDHPEKWEALIADWANECGREAAEIYAWKEATRLNRLLRRLGGAHAVQTALAFRHMGSAERAIRAAQKIMDAPPAEIVPAMPPMSVLDIIADIARASAESQPDDLLTEAIASGMSALPLPWGEAATYTGVWPPPMPERLDTPLELPGGMIPGMTS